MKKRILAACFMKRIEFESEKALDDYLWGLAAKHRQYEIVSRMKFPGGKAGLEIKEQYNNNKMF